MQIQYRVFIDGAFFMEAPASTIRKVFNLHKSAEDRMLTETEAGTDCELHFNGRSAYGTKALVQKVS